MATLSIIIPVYNEEETIAELLNRVRDAKLTIAKEIVIVNDGSTDQSKALIEDWIANEPAREGFQAILLDKTNGGKGSAVRAGIERSTGDVVIIQDADLEYDPNDYQRCVDPILVGKAQVVYGSRERLSDNRLHSSLAFYAGGLAVTYWMNLLFGASMTDEPTCYKTFAGDVIRNLLFEGDAFDWEPEITAKLLRLGYGIHEVPISYDPRRIDDGKKITWRDGVEAFWVALKWRVAPLHRERAKLQELLPGQELVDRHRRENWLLYLALIICFLLRVGIAIPGLSNPEDTFFRPDSATYVNPARALLADGRYNVGPDLPTPATLRPPGYSFFLAGTFVLTGNSLTLPVLIFCLMSAAVVVPIFWAGRHFGGAVVGFIASLFYAFNITAIAAAPMYLSDVLFQWCAAWQFFFFTRFYFKERTIDLWFGGILNGVATLVRPVGLFWLVPCVFLVLIFVRKSWPKRIIGAVGCVALFLMIVGPWMIRNNSVGAGYALGTNIGKTLYYHNCAALMSFVNGESAEDMRQRWMRDANALFAAEPERFSTEKAKNAYLISKAKAIIREHPILYARLHFRPTILLPDAPSFCELLGFTQSGRGTLDVLNRKGIAAAIKHYFGDKLWLLVPLLPLCALMGMMYFGCAAQFAIWIWQRQVYLFFFFLAFVVYYLILPGPIVMPRYQLPAIPLMAIMAGMFWLSVWQRVRRKQADS